MIIIIIIIIIMQLIIIDHYMVHWIDKYLNLQNLCIWISVFRWPVEVSVAPYLQVLGELKQFLRIHTGCICGHLHDKEKNCEKSHFCTQCIHLTIADLHASIKHFESTEHLFTRCPWCIWISSTVKAVFSLTKRINIWKGENCQITLDDPSLNQ